MRIDPMYWVLWIAFAEKWLGWQFGCSCPDVDAYFFLSFFFFDVGMRMNGKSCGDSGLRKKEGKTEERKEKHGGLGKRKWRRRGRIDRRKRRRGRSSGQPTASSPDSLACSSLPRLYYLKHKKTKTKNKKQVCGSKSIGERGSGSESERMRCG